VRFEGGEFRGGDEALLVGRSHYCDVRLTDLRVSRRQLRLLPGDGSTWTLRVEQDAAAVFLEGSVVAELAITGPMTVRLADAQSGPWLEVIPGRLRVLVHSLPARQVIDTPVQEQLIVELYSK